MQKLFTIKTYDEVIRVPKLGITHFDCTVNWFCKKRSSAVGDFCVNELGWINAASHLAEYAYQCFTEDEMLAVIYFLKTLLGANPEVCELYLPFTEIDIPYCSIPPEPAAGDNYGFIHLNKIPEQELYLSGYYDKDFKKVSPRMQIVKVQSLVQGSDANYNSPNFS